MKPTKKAVRRANTLELKAQKAAEEAQAVIQAKKTAKATN